MESLNPPPQNLPNNTPMNPEKQKKLIEILSRMANQHQQQKGTGPPQQPAPKSVPPPTQQVELSATQPEVQVNNKLAELQQQSVQIAQQIQSLQNQAAQVNQQTQFLQSGGTVVGGSDIVSIFGYTLNRTYFYIAIGVIILIVVGYFLWNWFGKKSNGQDSDDEFEDSDDESVDEVLPEGDKKNEK